MYMKNIEGIFAVNKPLGMSSQRAVQIVKYWARRRSGNKKIKVGHAGTLDPLATGVLVMAVGRTYTKKLDTIVAAQKEYTATIFLGQTSTTDDAEGEKNTVDACTVPSWNVISATIQKFIGDIAQTPPAYSAIKINGQEAYKRTRRGEQVEMKSRTVHIDDIQIISYKYPLLTVHVTCGKGTYIRSLARDIGDILGTGAYLSALTRTRVGQFGLEESRSLDMFALHIAVHATELDQERIDGTRVYMKEMLARCGALASDDQFFLYHQDTFNDALMPPQRKNYHIRKLSHIPLWTQTRFAFDLLRTKPDVVWMPLHNAPLIHSKKTKIVVTIHDLAFKFFPETFPQCDLRRLNFLTALAVRNADHIIAVSHATKNDLIRSYPHLTKEKITVVHHGVDVSWWRKRSDEKDVKNILTQYGIVSGTYLIHVGAIQPRKNLVTLIDAFVLVKKKFPAMKLVLVGGNGWLWQKTKDHAARSVYQSDIIFTGNVSREYVRALMHNACIFVFPSLYEGFGLAGVEAMAAGVPVVAARNSSITEVLGNAAQYFDATDIDACHDRIVAICEDSILRKEMCTQGLRRAENFSWDTCAKKTLAVLRR